MKRIVFPAWLSWLFMLAFIPAEAAVEKPTRTVDTSISATLSTGQVIQVRPTSDPDNSCVALQSAIDRALPGDVISVVPGVYRCDSLRLRKKSGDGWITITSSNADASLPLPGNRVAPTDHPNMPVIISRGANAPAIRTDSGAHNYRLVGLEVTKLDPSSFVQELIVIDADQNIGQTQVDNLSDFPHDVIVDRCYIHGLPKNDLKRGIRLYCFNCAVIDSYISEAHVIGQEAQAILFGGGPLKIANNYLEAAGENIFGADFLSLRTAHVANPTITAAALTSTRDLHVGDPIAFYDGKTNLFTHVLSIDGLNITYEPLPTQPSTSTVAYWGTLPTDIDIFGNYLYKQPSWNSLDPSYAGYHPLVKNLFELKSGRRVWFHDNALEHNWVDAQDGTAILLTVRNQYVKCYFCTVEDISIEDNIVVDAVNGVGVLHTDNLDISGTSQRVLIRNNLFTSIHNNFQQGAIDDETIDHNTISNELYALSVELGAIRKGNIFTNNIVVSTRSSGFHYNDANIPDWAAILPGWIMQGNVFTAINGFPTFLFMRRYEKGNYDVNSADEISFVDWRSGNFALSKSSFALGAAADGSDLGADVTHLLQNRTKIVSGTYVSRQPNAPPTPKPTPEPQAPAMNPPHSVFEGEGPRNSWGANPPNVDTNSEGSSPIEFRTCSISLSVGSSTIREKSALRLQASLSGIRLTGNAVTFLVDGRALSTTVTDDQGNASLVTRQLKVGSHTLVATANNSVCISQPSSIIVIGIPDTETSFTLDPLVLPDSTNIGKVAAHWNAPSVSAVELRIGTPDGALFAAGGSSGSAETGSWVMDGLTFFLQVAGNTDAAHTLAVAQAKRTTPQLAGTLRIGPDPIFTTGLFGIAELTWSAQAATTVEIHVGSPDGPLFTRGGSNGTATTGQWVADGTTFFLQDRSNAENPLTEAYTIATATAQVLTLPELGYLFITPFGSQKSVGSDGKDVARLTWSSSTAEKVEIHVGAPNGPLFASGRAQGSAILPDWAKNGQVFFLQDVTQAQPLSTDFTVATQIVDLSSDPKILLQASPNPMLPTPGSMLGSTTVYWDVPGIHRAELHVGAPNGPLVARGGSSGKAPISAWGREGTVLFLIDVSDDANNNVLGTVTLHLATE